MVKTEGGAALSMRVGVYLRPCRILGPAANVNGIAKTRGMGLEPMVAALFWGGVRKCFPGSAESAEDGSTV